MASYLQSHLTFLHFGMNEADPRVRLPTGILRFQEEGTTLGDIRKSYPNCFLLLRNPDPNNCDKEFHRDAFVLQANTTYELIIPNVNPTVNQPHQVPGEFSFVGLRDCYLLAVYLISCLFP